MNEMHKYRYDGPVIEFERCVADHWKAETVATSEKKAKSNLLYQYKKQNNKVPGCKVELPGRIVMVN